MKKINLKSIQSKELLSREQLKSVVGGLKPVPCRGADQTDCVTTDSAPGRCGYYMGIWGCIPK
ncbi:MULTISPECIES: hypothetical protein [Sphingobacterium]|uniref:hypothetical protein n=1 Tax=Sphingobacterium TaxID=28453 RepID=UPI00257F315F|nr:MULTISPECIES: hypothetical protein [Sphingobacterium]